MTYGHSLSLARVVHSLSFPLLVASQTFIPRLALRHEPFATQVSSLNFQLSMSSYFGANWSSTDHPWNNGPNYFTNPADQMSSYQFVNSLTSCYGQRVTAPPDPSSVTSPADYYSQQAYNSCYGPTVAASNSNSAAAYAGYLGQNGISDHHSPHNHQLNSHPRHLNPHPSTPGAAVTSAAVVACGQQPHPRHHQSPVLTKGTTTPSSCKYVPVELASSPQYVSTSSTSVSQSSDSRSRVSPTAQSTRNSAASSTSGQAGGQTTAGENSSKGPASGQPHIYPWMKGQSKFATSECHFFSLSVLHLLHVQPPFLSLFPDT